MNNITVNEVVSVTMKAKDAANYLGISYWLLLEMTKQNKIPYIPCGARKLFRKEALEKWMQEQELKTSTTIEDSDNQYGTLRKIY